MAEVDLSIGGRSFKIVCADGEEPSLHAAAALLDAEARLVVQQLGQLSEARLLLMAGLMLADQTVAIKAREEKLRTHLESDTAPSAPASSTAANAEAHSDQPAVSQKLMDELAQMAARAEKIADMVEARATADAS